MKVFYNNVGFQNEDDVKCGNTIFNEDVIVPVVIAIKQLQINPKKKKKIQGFNGIRTHGLCIS